MDNFWIKTDKNKLPVDVVLLLMDFDGNMGVGYVTKQGDVVSSDSALFCNLEEDIMAYAYIPEYDE